MALSLFYAGHFAAGAFSKRVAPPVAKSGRPTVSALMPKAIDHRGVSQLVAEHDGYSGTACDLLALFDGAEFTLALAALSQAELGRLVEELAQKEVSPKLDRMVDAVFERWVEIEPRRAVELTLGAKSGSLAEFRLRIKALRSLTRIDPDEALEMALGMHDPRLAPHLAGEVLEMYARFDPPAAARLLLERDSFAREPAIADSHLAAYLVQNWAKTDPVSAAAFVGRVPEAMRAAAVETLAKIWAESDAPAAYRWMGAQGEVGDKAMAKMLKSFVTIASTSDPDFVIELINTEEGYRVREHAMGQLAQHYARTQPEAAIEWLGTLEEFDDRDRAARGTIAALPPGDLEDFTRVLATVPPGAKHWTIEAFALRWAEHQPELAIAWVRDDLDLRSQHHALEGLTSAVAYGSSSHHAKIAAVIDTKPDLQRVWMTPHADMWCEVDPAAAFEWVAGVASPLQREEVVGRVLERWHQSDPKAARAGLEAAVGLPDELRGRLLEKLTGS